MRADDIPVAHTPPGGWVDMPPPVLASCDEPLPDGSPDLRGMWRVVSVTWKPGVPASKRMDDHVERIEQCGDRICITAAGIVHDMRADGTEERGVHDVDPTGRPVHVVCTYEKEVHTLRPIDMPGVEVTRRLDGDQLVWDYGPLFTARLERVREPADRRG
jgi:hypothetical protein